MTHRLHLIVCLFCLAGCGAPRARLTFPYRPLVASSQPQWFDVDRNGRNDFAITFNPAGRVDALCYDDNEDGQPDRIYRLGDYANDTVPHVIILLDSVPFQCVAERYAAGQFRWFDPPTKVIAPFASLTEICFNELMHGPPLPGMIDQHYDRRTRKVHNGLFERAIRGHQYPWERYQHYRSTFMEEGLSYLNPRPWYQAELERARRALDSSTDRTTIVYLTSASGMACKFGRPGIDEVLDGAQRLCLQLLYERHGALKISLMADHGHNMMPSKNIRVDRLLRADGFHVTERLEKPNDVVLEVNGLVTYAAVRTVQPQGVAQALLKEHNIQMAMYLEGDRVIVRDASGTAAILCRDGKLGYRVISHDVLGYQPLIGRGKIDADGFASRDDWFAATVDHQYPDGPSRLWDAFHRLVVDPPDVMFTMRDGYCAGLASFEHFITMKSTHGSLNQLNSATFLLTMTGRVNEPLRTKDVMQKIEPTYTAAVRSGR